MRGLSWFAEYGKGRGEKELSIIFHGGEPMVIPARQYGQCMEELLQRYPDIGWHFFMQTNGTILDWDYINLIKRYDIHMGISLDGPEYIHNAQRKTKDKKNTFRQVVDNIICLKDNNISVSALMVLTKSSMDGNLTYLEKFYKLGLSLKINPLLNIGEAGKHQELALEPGDYGNYLRDVFDYVIDHELDIHISPLEDIFEAVLYNRQPRGCTFRAGCNNSFICINQNGEIYPCGRFADAYKYKIGNIWNGISEDGKETLTQLQNRRCVRLPEKCRKCRYAGLCHGGCSASAAEGPGTYGETVMCEDYRRVFDYLYKDGMEKYRRYLLSKREQVLQQMQG